MRNEDTETRRRGDKETGKHLAKGGRILERQGDGVKTSGSDDVCNVITSRLSQL
jgi:ribosomal protein L27